MRRRRPDERVDVVASGLGHRAQSLIASVRAVRRVCSASTRCSSATVLLWALNITVTKYVFEHGCQPLAYGTIRYSSPRSLFWRFTLLARALVPDRAARDLLVLLGAAAVGIFAQPALLRLRAQAHERVDGRAPPRDDADLHGADLAGARARAARRARFWIGGRRHLRGRRARRGRRSGGVCRRASRATLLALVDRARPGRCYSVAIAPLMRRYSPYRISALVLAIGWRAARARQHPAARRARTSTLGWLVWLGLVLRGHRAARAHEHPLVHGDRPRRAVARVALREPAAVLRRALRAADALGVACTALEIAGGVRSRPGSCSARSAAAGGGRRSPAAE